MAVTTKSVDPNLQWLLQSDWQEAFIPGLGREPWVIYRSLQNPDKP